MQMTVYRIRDWNRHFENNRSRVIGALTWVPVPNKHDGEGFLTIMEHERGIVIYGCWHLILQVASKCTPRGTLIKDDGTPHTAASIARKTGWRQVDDIQASLDFCSSSQVGWIEVLTQETSGGRQDNVSTLSPKGREGKGMEGTEEKGMGGEGSTPAPFDFEKTIPTGAKHADLYRDTMTALSGKLTTCYGQWFGNFHSKGITPTKETVAAVNVSMLNRPGPDWGTYGNRILEFAIMDLCKTHGKKSVLSGQPENPVMPMGRKWKFKDGDSI